MTQPRPTRQHIYLSSNLWHGLWIIQQPTCYEIQKDDQVLYVERFCSVFTVLRYPRLWPRLFAWLRGAHRVTANLRLLAPLPLFHLGHRFPRVFRLEFAIQRIWIRWWAEQGKGEQRILWVDHPLYECAIHRFGERASIYHVGDEVRAFPTSNVVATQRLERALLKKVDIVFAAADQLAADKRANHKRVYTVWNAIDPHTFASEPSQRDIQDVERIPAPRVAFVGVIDDWVDVQLFALAADRLPSIHFVVVAPTSVYDRPLRPMANVHFLGRRDRFAIPGLLRRCSASVVPFRKSALTERLVPLKLFEALAAGIMPVCTEFSPDLSGLEGEGHAAVARSDDEFVRLIQEVVEADTPERRERLSKYGLQQTWTARWADMRKRLEAYLADSSTRA